MSTIVGHFGRLSNCRREGHKKRQCPQTTLFVQKFEPKQTIDSLNRLHSFVDNEKLKNKNNNNNNNNNNHNRVDLDFLFCSFSTDYGEHTALYILNIKLGGGGGRGGAGLYKIFTAFGCKSSNLFFSNVSS